MPTRILLLAIFALALIVPSGAVADDAGLKRAGTAHDAQFKNLGKATGRAARSWARAPRSTARARRVIRLLRRTRVEIAEVVAELEVEEPSSEAGATYKRYLLASMREFDTSMRLQELSVRATTRGNPRLGRSYVRSAERHLKKAGRYETAAKRALP